MNYKRKSARVMAALLCSLMLLTSCGDENTTQNDTQSGEITSAPAETKPVDALDARMDVDDGLGTKDFGGRTFRIFGDDACPDYYIMDSMTGDAMDDAVYQRNLEITERFNVKLEAKVFFENDLVTNLKTSVLAGEDEYQLFAGHIIYAGGAVADGLYYNWYDIPNIDFSKPWWSNSNVEDLTYDGKAFLAMGDFAMSTIGSTYCMYYNKGIAADYDQPDFYGIVNDGSWTIDKVTEISKGIYRDINGDGAKDVDDLYGMTLWSRTPLNAFLWAFGDKIATKQSDGTIALDYYDDKFVDIFEKMYEICFNSEGIYQTNDNKKSDDITTMFTSNRALLFPDLFDTAATKLRDFETDYGILPYPKWDEAQDGYYTMVDGGHEGLAVPFTVKDVDFVGTIIEALNAESYKRTVPVYYDIVLKTKGSRDEESVAMLDMIFESRIFDFGYVYGKTLGPAFWPQDLIGKNSSDIVSYYESKHGAFDTHMADVFAFFEDYE